MPVVYAANYPLAYFAERIGGDRFKVVLPMPADIDPAFWEPGDDDVRALQSADIILLNGATYSKWLSHVTLPDEKLKDTSSLFKDSYIKTQSAVTHSHGKDGEHSHAGTAFTTWLDLSLAAQQAEAVKNALFEFLPEHIELYALNYDLLYTEIMELDKRMRVVGEKLAGRPLVVSHPVYQYWARRYGFNVREVHWEADTIPDESQLNELRTLLRDHPATHMVWEDTPDERSVALLKEMGITSLVYRPDGNRPEQGQWLSTMQHNVATMESLAQQ